MTFGDQMMFWPEDRPIVRQTGLSMRKAGYVGLGAVITLTLFGGLVSLYDAGKQAGRNGK